MTHSPASLERARLTAMRRRSHSTICASAVFALMGAAFTSNAQAQSAAPGDGWQFTAGAGSVASPSYPGSSTTRGGIVPIFIAQRGAMTLGALPVTGIPLGAAYELVQDSPWRAGVAIGTGLGKARSESQSARLRGWGDVPASAQISAYTSYTQGAWAASASVAGDLGSGSGPSQGTRATFSVENRMRASQTVFLSAGPSLVWADQQHHKTFYGITPAQSGLSGLAAYNAHSGIVSVGLSFGASVQFAPQWSMMARANFAQLQGSAAKSPLVQNKQQTSLSALVLHRF